jgi:asparaginyl-tRNA synthetase
MANLAALRQSVRHSGAEGSEAAELRVPGRVGVDLQSEHERYLTEKYAKKPVIVMNYPKDVKAFYMRVNDDGRTVAPP